MLSRLFDCKDEGRGIAKRVVLNEVGKLRTKINNARILGPCIIINLELDFPHGKSYEAHTRKFPFLTGNGVRGPNSRLMLCLMFAFTLQPD